MLCTAAKQMSRTAATKGVRPGREFSRRDVVADALGDHFDMTSDDRSQKAKAPQLQDKFRLMAALFLGLRLPMRPIQTLNKRCRP
jgi:hypothetical protein